MPEETKRNNEVKKEYNTGTIKKPKPKSNGNGNNKK